MFSWYTNDTNERIVADVEKTYHLIDNKGNTWSEKCYEGYGKFGGKDFFVLLAEMNGIEGKTSEDLRLAGIYLYHSGDADSRNAQPFLSPNIVSQSYASWENRAPKDDPEQGM